MMKREIERIAQQRGESEAVIIREAISDYIRRGTPPRSRSGHK
jgi:predicted transcriptional regulator